ncbi:glycosyltransferase family 2 protein [Emticicia sp. 21SJ11W-3]|uniref:glycosyltransferase family 2 protein n=1 Tax=Emticicia sp. 21SJ11W-3 TaxID=2916755 RepID=UPI0020A08DB4|nr:glycosyltransferase family 2 protein [Emticicia sp. 21SJ11W-3]UTA68667.1 glycosyltransferase family 2 protein [Emticicia sp. 21SJ11W-3]
MSNLEISVIVPVFNSSKHLSTCIDSILAQTFSNFELILINDGSTDSSGIICNDYEKRYNNIRVFHKENGGVSSARNIGLRESRGSWIVFADSDDYVDKDWLKTFIDNSNNVELVVQGFNILYNQTIVYNVIKQKNKAGVNDCKGNSIKELKEYILSLVKEEIIGYLWCKMFKREIIEKNNISFNTLFKVQEDEDFILRYFNCIHSFKNVRYGQYYYNYPDFSSKYTKDIVCLTCIWNSYKLLFTTREEIEFLSKAYNHQVIEAIVKMYKTTYSTNERLGYMSFYIKEFHEKKPEIRSKSGKVFIFFLFKRHLLITDFICRIIFNLKINGL